MQTTFARLASITFLSTSAFWAAAAGLELQLSPRDGKLELSWPGTLRLDSGLAAYPVFQLERSEDLRNWSPLGDPTKLAGDDAWLRYLEQASAARTFYRLRVELPAAGKPLASGGEEVFGYAAAFDQELQRLGEISVADFSSRYPLPSPYFGNMPWDPMAARYANLFATDPAANNVGRTPSQPGYRMYDFRLNAAEVELFRRNGFVVTKRLGTGSFAESFYRLWNDDLPVFISTDAILQAWHRSYENMLIELEAVWLKNLLREILDAMAAQVAAAQGEAAPEVFRQSVLDADYFLTVARSLLQASPVPSSLGQDERVQAALDAIARQSYECFEPFGISRWVDFSQFIPRSHYDNDSLRDYFKAMMWLGRMDLRVGGFEPDCNDQLQRVSPRQLGTAIVLGRLLELAGKFERWRDLDRLIETFVGWTDSMNFRQLRDLTQSAGINTLADIPTTNALAALQQQLESGALGAQNIRGDAIAAPLAPGDISLPRSFTFMGQRFVLDSWALGRVIDPQITRTRSNGTRELVHRRVASGLDVAFSVFANNHTVPEIARRMTNALARSSTDHMIRWRDGYQFQHNLAATRNVIDTQTPSAWEGNIYMGWLAALRELSRPTLARPYPQVMRTEAWAYRTLNAQLASWTQLRHDTLLYAKPTYTPPGLCSFPDGYVEPRVEFWHAMEKLARSTAEMIRSLPYQGPANLAVIQTNQINFLVNFAEKIGRLLEISEQELLGQSLSAEQVDFIDGMMEPKGDFYSSSRTYRGWYPLLFYAPYGARTDGNWDRDHGAGKFDALIADVHNDSPAVFFENGKLVEDPGGVLHEGVGRVDLLYLVVGSTGERRMYAGPVFSYYEFETRFPDRKTDNQWQEDLNNGLVPNPPSWTSTFLAPMPMDGE
jgi:hypothetical protein